MGKEEIILTQEGYNKAQKELEYLVSVMRLEIAEKIKEAKSFGDLSENAEYDEAKNNQDEIEKKIAKLEYLLNHAVVVDDTDIHVSKVSIGSLVKLYDEEFDEEIEYLIVGATEADPFNGKISNISPLGKALIGKEVGEKVEVEAPDGVIRYSILEINVK